MRASSLPSWWAGALLAASVISATATVPASAQQEIFVQGNQFYRAEDYHQEYWTGEGQRNPYCLAVIPPKLMKLRKSFQKYLKEDA